VIPKITDAVANEVVRLHDNQTDAAEIAQQLNLKKTQVSAIIAYFRPPKVTDEQVSAEGNERNGDREHLRNGDAAEATDRSQIVAEYSSAAETVPLVQEAHRHTADASTEQEDANDEGIFIGNDAEYGDPLYWNPQNADSVVNPHMMIVGESGSGKTYATLCLTAELAHRELPTIIFDYAQGFELEQLDEVYKKYINVQEFRIGEDGISLNPLQIFPKDVKGPASVATRVSDVFDAVYHLGHIQRKVLIEAILSTFEKVGMLTSVQSSWKGDPPTFEQLQQTLDDLASDKQYANNKNAVGLAARLTTFFMLSSFSPGGRVWSWESLFADQNYKVHVLQFRGLEGKTQHVTLEILLWHLFFYLKSHGQAKLRSYVVLDEAHHLSFREGGPIDLLLREARKFGLGIIFASQQPEDFSQVAFDNTASKLIFQTTDPSHKVSRSISSKCSNYNSPESIHEVISVLKQGNALFVTKNRGHQVQIADLRSRATLWGEAHG
jgi:DNA phosphorothioation-dependent restriction protein DptH